MTNTEILNAPKGRLDPIDRQRQFILKMHSCKMPCPNCGTLQNVFEAQAVSIDDYNVDGIGGDKPAKCISCGRGLIRAVPFVVVGGPGWSWELVPQVAS